jgi:hypothetical protein
MNEGEKFLTIKDKRSKECFMKSKDRRKKGDGMCCYGVGDGGGQNLKYSEKITQVSIFGLSESAEPDHDDKHVD